MTYPPISCPRIKHGLNMISFLPYEMPHNWHFTSYTTIKLNYVVIELNLYLLAIVYYFEHIYLLVCAADYKIVSAQFSLLSHDLNFVLSAYYWLRISFFSHLLSSK